MRTFRPVVAALAVSGVTISFGGCSSAPSQSTNPMTRANAAVRRAAGIALPIIVVAQPPGVGCVAVKINVGGGGPPWWGVINCTNGLAYNLPGGPGPVPLALPVGAVSEKAYDIDSKGFTVGVAITAAGAAIPTLWGPGGAPVAGWPTGPCIAGVPPLGIAAGLYKGGFPGFPIVGQTLAPGPAQACWWFPGPHPIPPPPAPMTSIAYDVNTKPIYVGQFAGAAAAGVGPGGPLAPIAGTTASSVAYAINTGSVIVGQEDFGGVCGGFPKGAGFEGPFAGVAAAVPPLPGDCRGGLEDINDPGGAVGYSFNPAIQQAYGFGLAPPYPAGPFNINTGVAGPWINLSDAPGIDDKQDIIATDTGAFPSQVYVIL
ncbi:MAG: hypothetical protein JOZ86_14015 [Candidatus Eremiobacteraeota bacterium]|nr:hypothetical protein [Candidatus Eremiobacteraeota bacterium]